MIRVFSLCALLIVPDLAMADGRIVWADVSAVEPIIDTQTLSPDPQDCRLQKPSNATGLTALLEWDLLRCREREVQHTTGFRVHYQWAGRKYSHVSSQLPGDKVRLRVYVTPNR